MTVRLVVASAALVASCALVSAFAAIVFEYVPALAAVTFTVTVQLALAATLPPLSAMFVLPVAAVTKGVLVLVQVELALAGDATIIPEGRLSVTANWVSASALAAVPVDTHKADTRVSNRMEKASSSPRLNESPS